MTSRSLAATPISILVAACALALAPRPAAAGADPAAEKMFRDGKQLMKDGKIAEACVAFEASEHTEHNVATLMNLADCREKNHQIATAWALFLEVDSTTRGDTSMAMLGDTARARAGVLEAKLSYLIINVPADHQIEGLVITRDGVTLDPGAWNRAVPLDGGEHVVAAKGPGHEPWSTTITLAATEETQTVEVPKFTEIPKPAPAPALAPIQPPPSGTMPFVAAMQPAPSRDRTLLYVFGGAGALTMLVGLGIYSQGTTKDAQADLLCSGICSSPDFEQTAAQLRRDASTDEKAGGVTMVLGAAAIVTGILIYTSDWNDPAPASHAVSISPLVGDGSGIVVSGRF